MSSLVWRLAEASARLMLAAPLVVTAGFVSPPLGFVAGIQCLEGTARVLAGEDLGRVVGVSPDPPGGR